MRKHFLILMLMALLPLAGWALPVADPVDLSTATVTFTWGDGHGFKKYNAEAIPEMPTTVTISPAEGDAQNETVSGNTKLTFKWVDANGNDATEAVNAGRYYLQVTAVAEGGYDNSQVSTSYYEIQQKPLVVSAKATVDKVYGFEFAPSDFYTIDPENTFVATEGETLGDPVTVTYANGAAGTKTFTITGKAFDNYAVSIADVSRTGTLNVAKRPLKVIAADFEYTYGDGTVIDTDTWTYSYEGIPANDNSGLIPGDVDGEGDPKPNVLVFGAPTIQDTNGQAYSGNAGNYSVTPNVTSASNYEITAQAGALRVLGRSLQTEGIEATITGIDTYDGFDQTPIVTVMDGETQIAANQLSVSYHVYTGATTVSDAGTPKIKNAGKYQAWIVPAENSNYAGDAIKIDVTMNQASLIATFDGLTKLYDGNAPTEEELAAKVSIDGFLGEDTETSVFAEEGAVKPTVTTAQTNATTGKTLTPAGGVTKNYDFIYVSGTLVINKAKVKVVLKDVTEEYGTNAANTTSWSNLITDIAGAGSSKSASDVNYNKFIKEVYVQVNTAANGSPIYNETAAGDMLTVLKKTEATHKVGNDNNVFDYGYIDGSSISRATGTDVTEAGYALNGDFTSNSFNSNYELGEVVPAVFKITEAALEIKADAKIMVYGATEIPTLTYSGADNLTDEQKALLSISRVAGTDAGTYTITVTGPNKIGNYNITYKTAPFVIKKANLTLTAKPQTLYTGMSAADLNGEYEQSGLIGDDTVDLVFGFNTAGSDPVATEEIEIDEEAVTVLKLDDATYKVYDEGITIALAEADEDLNDNARVLKNYNITWVRGTLTVIKIDAQTIVLKRPLRNDWDADADDIAADVIAAHAGEEVKVTFGDFTMYKEKWYAMVLPFNTTVAEVSQKFGYAIVDLLNTDNNQNAVSFKLHMQEIAANTPFIIKVYKEMNMNEVLFTGKEIVNPAPADLVQTDKFGNKFTGTYTAKNADWLAGQDYLFSVAETNNTYGHAVNGATPAATSYLNPVCAYITYKNAQNANNNAPIIYIEEADGSTTAISSITADGEMIPAQGWYTINGMKLETVPTEKGVYINNGKKIVIK